ncbi:MFS transporter, partial [Aduncisulcus paluster]
MYGTFFLVILVGVFTAKTSAVPVVWIIVLGAALVTGGGFAGYTCLTSLSATIAHKGRAQASSLFLASSFSGSAVFGLVGSRVLTDAGWA